MNKTEEYSEEYSEEYKETLIEKILNLIKIINNQYDSHFMSYRLMCDFLDIDIIHPNTKPMEREKIDGEEPISFEDVFSCIFNCYQDIGKMSISIHDRIFQNKRKELTEFDIKCNESLMSEVEVLFSILGEIFEEILSLNISCNALFNNSIVLGDEVNTYRADVDDIFKDAFNLSKAINVITKVCGRNLEISREIEDRIKNNLLT